MKYAIKSNRYFSLHYWFLREGDFGVSFQYLYRGDAFVVLDSEFLDSEESGEEQFADDLESLQRSINTNGEWRMRFPAPYYFTDAPGAVFWSRPLDESKGGTSGALIDSNSFHLRISVEDRTPRPAKKVRTGSSRETFGTWDEQFKWTGDKYSRASEGQDTKQYQLLANIWNSESWREHASLVAYMSKAYDLELDENEAEFYSPELLKDWRDSSRDF